MRKGVFKNVMAALGICAVALACTFGVHVNAMAANGNEIEPNDTYATATQITAGTPINGALSSDEDQDWYKIIATDDGPLTMVFNHTKGTTTNLDLSGWYIKLYHVTGTSFDPETETPIFSTLVRQGSTGAVTLGTVGLTKNDVYYIQVSASAVSGTTILGQAGGLIYPQNVAYSISATFTKDAYYEKELNEVWTTATNLTIDMPTTGNLQGTSDLDYYRVTATENGKLTIDFGHELNSKSLNYWNIYIYKLVEGKLSDDYVTTRVVRSDITPTTMATIGVVKGDVYIIKVYSENTGSLLNGGCPEQIEYTLTASLQADANYEHEFNEIYTDATPLPLGTAISGNMRTAADVDYYKMVFPTAGTIKVVFHHSTINSSGNYWNVNITKLDKDGEVAVTTESIQVNQSGTNDTTVYTITGTKDDVYFVKVSSVTGYCAEQVDYSVKGTFTFAAPKSMKATTTVNSATLTWSKVGAAEGYVVYKYNGSKKTYTKLGTTDAKTRKYEVTKLKSATKYSYAVRAFIKVDGTTYYSEYVNITTATKPAKVSSLKATSSKAQQVKFSYGSVSNATGYQIYYCTKKNGSYKKLATTGNTSYTYKKFKSGTTYYVKVRAYKKVNDKVYYGAFSDIKTIKVK